MLSTVQKGRKLHTSASSNPRLWTQKIYAHINHHTHSSLCSHILVHTHTHCEHSEGLLSAANKKENQE
ncbi:hypothetical protein Q5P01_022424 [Channa striata]|uniref:Uncharacterized protein n=1 Tax=Channa striata TaxID=64152 RepID=A0AA88LPR2_CHASR|nr:hypothetical protein Q5P01_022424 [Channa striata]